MTDSIKMKEEVDHEIKHCVRVQYCFGRWYLLVPYKVQDVDNKVANVVRTKVGIDFGIRNFGTYFSENGEQGVIGGDLNLVADNTRKKIDSIKREIGKCRKLKCKKKVKRLKRAWYRANARASNLISDFHWKTIKYLLDKFHTLYAPRLHTSFMLTKESSLPDIVKKRASFQCHGVFYSRLLYKASVTPGTTIHDFEEHGTTATCSSCGGINPNVGESEIFECAYCHLRAGRDTNSAKNHLLKPTCGKKNY
jgi:putative transposase